MKGHNPRFFQLKDRRFLILTHPKIFVETNEQTISDMPAIKGLSKYWKEYFVKKDNRGRTNKENDFSTFVRREDGSFIALTRHGCIAISKTGYSPYRVITQDCIYPEVEARFEDPGMWRTNVQYNLLMNDWQGHRGLHLRSKDGIHWVSDDGLAYEPDSLYKVADGTTNSWTKLEIVRLNQDKYGRATSVNFAAIDSPKAEDLGNDNHSSKNIFYPLIKGKLLTILNSDPIDNNTKEILVRVQAEPDFNPQTDMDLLSLKFGVSGEVNYGRGCKLISSKNVGKDVILSFNAKGNHFTKDNFAGKLLGKTSKGKILYGYSRLPGVKYIEPLLSADTAKFTRIKGGVNIEVTVHNYGQVASKESKIKVITGVGSHFRIMHSTVPPLKPFEKAEINIVRMETRTKFEPGKSHQITIELDCPGMKPDRFTRHQVLLPKLK